MKKRASLKSAEYAIARSGWYEQQCSEILYRKGMVLQIDGENVYIKTDRKRSFLLKLTNPKQMWFEIWFKLADR